LAIIVRAKSCYRASDMTTFMTLGPKLATLAALLGLLPAVAHGQSYSQSYSQPAYPSIAGPDVAYCQRLANTYARYIDHDWNYGEYARQRANNDAQVAMTQCETNPGSAIPVLERELRNNHFTLPPRG
jgi:hypothetical protein